MHTNPAHGSSGSIHVLLRHLKDPLAGVGVSKPPGGSLKPCGRTAPFNLCRAPSWWLGLLNRWPSTSCNLQVICRLQPMNIIDDAFHLPAFSGLYSSESIRDAAFFVYEARRNRKDKLDRFG
jgi:hypothetical protein